MANSSKEEMNIEKLVATLKELTTAYERSKAEEQRARNNTTDALNRLNEAQQKLSRVLGDMQKAAPWDSDWKRAARDKRNVPVATCGCEIVNGRTDPGCAECTEPGLRG